MLACHVLPSSARVTSRLGFDRSMIPHDAPSDVITRAACNAILDDGAIAPHVKVAAREMMAVMDRLELEHSSCRVSDCRSCAQVWAFNRTHPTSASP
jgi:hypothetical protein